MWYKRGAQFHFFASDFPVFPTLLLEETISPPYPYVLLCFVKKKFFLRPHPCHIEIPGQGIETEPQLQQCQILQPTMPGLDQTQAIAVTQAAIVGSQSIAP